VERELGNDNESIQRFVLASEKCSKINHEAKEFGPLDYDIKRNLGIAYLKVNEFNKAADCFENAVNQAEKTGKKALVPAVTSYLGLALVLSGNHKNGFLQLEKARQLYPIDTQEQSMDWAAHRYHMGRAYQEAGNFINAISEYNESLRLRLQMISPQIGPEYYNSRVGDTHAGLGQCYFYLNQLDNAEKWLKKALGNYQALNNLKKIKEIEKLLKTVPAPDITITKSNISGAGLFAHKLRNESVANAIAATTIKDVKSNNFSA
jgi:tetratricopeptide (TPR) repeat protein